MQIHASTKKKYIYKCFIYFVKQRNINQNANENQNANMFEIEMSVEHKNACRDEYTNTRQCRN